MGDEIKEARESEATSCGGNLDMVTLISPEDGGFPRRTNDLEKIACNYYRINIPNALQSHMMVEALNTSASVQKIRIEIYPDPRTAVLKRAVDKPQPKGHYYYRTPAGKWLRIHLEDDCPCLIIPLEPGVTRISGVPFFTYAEYIAYVESLADPRISKNIAFTHENGAFKTYRITITNHGGVKNKMKICFGRANHTNESSGFFMAQGIIEWLLSGDKAANLDNIEWSFYLCADPKAIYYHYGYNEIDDEIYDTGKKAEETYLDALRTDGYHIIQCEHMWNNEHGGISNMCKVSFLECESYEYHDPLSGNSTNTLIFPELMPTSQVWKDYVSYWPHWFEFGTDTYVHSDSRRWDDRIPDTLLMYNEITFFGKDSGDLIANMKEQGKQWARATSQVYLRFQERNHYWDDSHPKGAVDIEGAIMLPRPEHLLLENMLFLEGNASRKCNAEGGQLVIFRKQYDHGLGMKAGDSVTFYIPDGVNSFKANVAMDDSSKVDICNLQFIVKLDNNEIWRSNHLKKYESQMIHIKLPGKGKLTLSVEGEEGTLANWGGARLSINDPDML